MPDCAETDINKFNLKSKAMIKPPKFLFCRNEMAKTKNMFILHTREPKFLARVIGGHPFEIEVIDSLGSDLSGLDMSFILKRMESSWISNKNLMSNE